MTGEDAPFLGHVGHGVLVLRLALLLECGDALEGFRVVRFHWKVGEGRILAQRSHRKWMITREGYRARTFRILLVTARNCVLVQLDRSWAAFAAAAAAASEYSGHASHLVWERL